MKMIMFFHIGWTAVLFWLAVLYDRDWWIVFGGTLFAAFLYYAMEETKRREKK